MSVTCNKTALCSTLESDVSVILKSQNINFRIPTRDITKTLLEAAEEQGVVMEHGCRSGMCDSCKTNLVSGEVGGNSERQQKKPY